jgi:hypothetical protein
MKNEVKVIAFVNTTKKHQDRIDNIIETWANDIDTIFYSDHQDPECGVIKVSNRDDYASGEEKQINVLNKIKDLANVDDEPLLDVYDWFFFVDDDTFINVENLNKHKEFLDDARVYGSIFNSEKDSENPMYVKGIVPKDAGFPSGGAGFLVSSKTIKLIPTFNNYQTVCGDVSAGLNFHFNGVQQCDLMFFNSQKPEFYNHRPEQIADAITYHYIKTFDDMKKLCEGKYE